MLFDVGGKKEKKEKAFRTWKGIQWIPMNIQTSILYYDQFQRERRDWIKKRKTAGVERVKHPKHAWCERRELEPQIPLPAQPSSAPVFPAPLSSHPSSGQHFLPSSPALSSVDPTLCVFSLNASFYLPVGEDPPTQVTLSLSGSRVFATWFLLLT